MKTEPESITVRLPREMKAELEKMALSQDLTISQFVRRHFVKALNPSPKPQPRRKAHGKKAA